MTLSRAQLKELGHRTRELLEQISGGTFPAVFSDQDTLLIGTGRRTATDDERAALGQISTKLPLVLS